MRISSIALANLRRRQSKAVFLATGIVVGIGTLVALINLNGALREEIGTQMDRFGANIIVTPESGSLALEYGGLSVGGVSFDQHELSNEDLGRIREIPFRKRLSILAPKLITTVPMEGRRTLVAGVDFSSEMRLKQWWSVVGRTPAAPDEILLGYDVARSLDVIDLEKGATPADGHSLAHHSVSEEAFTLSRDTLHISGARFRVAGVIGQTGGADDRVVFASLDRVQALVGKPNQLSLIEVSALCKDCPIDDIVAQIRTALPNANVSAIQQAVRGRTDTVERLGRFSSIVSVVVLALGALIIFTTMMGAIVERTKEIGVLRAIGFRRSHITRVLLLEIIVISATGGILGWIFGMLASQLMLPYFAEGAAQILVDWRVLLLAISLSILTGISSSVYPVIKASRLDPSEAVRSI